MKYPCLLIKKINEISSAKYNPRKITDEAMGRLTKSLAEFGNIQPITWNVRTGNVVGGHQRLKVYKAMGKTEVDVWAVDLDEQKEKAANIALNKLSGEFDMPMLKDILEEIDTGDLDMEITGFGMDEIALMMEATNPDPNFAPGTEDEQGLECQPCIRCSTRRECSPTCAPLPSRRSAPPSGCTSSAAMLRCCSTRC